MEMTLTERVLQWWDQDAVLAATVPPQRRFTGQLPQNTTQPALALYESSRVPQGRTSSSRTMEHTVTLELYTQTYQEVFDLVSRMEKHQENLAWPGLLQGRVNSVRITHDENRPTRFWMAEVELQLLIVSTREKN